MIADQLVDGVHLVGVGHDDLPAQHDIKVRSTIDCVKVSKDSHNCLLVPVRPKTRATDRGWVHGLAAGSCHRAVLQPMASIAVKVRQAHVQRDSRPARTVSRMAARCDMPTMRSRRTVLT